MTKNMHLLKTKNPHFINARTSGMSKTTICCWRYIKNLCGEFDECADCPQEFRDKLESELEGLREAEEE